VVAAPKRDAVPMQNMRHQAGVEGGG